jgi:hypothetical protein
VFKLNSFLLNKIIHKAFRAYIKPYKKQTMATTKTTTTAAKKPKCIPFFSYSRENMDNEDSEFHEFLVDELKDIYWAEKHLARALPKMKKAAASTELAAAFEKHAEETNTHIATLEQV